MGGVLGASALLSLRKQAFAQFPTFPPSPPMEPFVDRLPLPPVLQPTSVSMVNGAPRAHYDVPMREVLRPLHRDLPPTRVWGYWGMYPGPKIEARRDEPITVKWISELPDHHMLRDAIDPTLHGAGHDTPESPVVVHLHGGVVLPEFDGHPEAWFTRGFAEKGPYFYDEVYHYPNAQRAATLWYHDHTLAFTRLNVVAGLAGLYIIRDEEEESLGLPDGAYEIPLLIQDRRFNPDGSLWYPTEGIYPPAHPIWFPDYLGDVAVVNGKVYPYLEVEPRKYRFRILNGANARIFNLKLSSGQPFIQIGADVGFLPKPVAMESLWLSNAERADVILDFSEFEGEDIVMTNDAPTPFPIGPPPLPGVGPSMIMQFRVRRRNGDADTSKIPDALPTLTPLKEEDAARSREILLSEDAVMVAPGVHLPTRLLLEGLPYHDPVITEPSAGSTEIWEFVNVSLVAHPMHVHLAKMQVLDRRPFDVDHYHSTEEIMYTGPATPPAPNEVNAPKDTVFANVNEVTRVLLKFDLPPGTPLRLGEKFRYVHHCHILEHEDNEMMRPYYVGDMPAEFLNDGHTKEGGSGHSM